MNIVAQDSAMVEEVNYYGIKEVAGQSYTFDTTKNKAYLEQYDRELGSGLYQVLIQENGRTRRFISSQGHGKQVTASNRFVGWYPLKKYCHPPLSTMVKITYFWSSAIVSNSTITVDKTADTVDKTFVTLNADTPTYAPSLGLSQANQKGQYIYIMLDYYSAAITSFYSYNIGVERFNKGLAFGCDFSITFYRIDNDRGKV